MQTIDIDNHVKFSFYLSKPYLEKLILFTETKVFEEDSWGLDMSPTPLLVDEELIAPLDGKIIISKEINPTNLINECLTTIDSLWQFTEYRNRLNIDSEIEKDGLNNFNPIT